LDWGASQFLSPDSFVGAAGYLYHQVSGDSGSGNKVGSFESRVSGVGPQLRYLFPVGHLHGFASLNAYWEFDAAHRASGHNFWLVFAISPTGRLDGAGTESRGVKWVWAVLGETSTGSHHSKERLRAEC